MQENDLRGQGQEPQHTKKWQVYGIFKKIDQFGHDVPAFNIAGEQRMNTVCGGAVTFTIFLIIGLYTMDTFIRLLEQKFPSTQSNILRDYYTGDD